MADNEKRPPLLATVPQAARELNLSRSKFYELISRGCVRVVRFDGAVRVHRAEIERLARDGL